MYSSNTLLDVCKISAYLDPHTVFYIENKFYADFNKNA